MVRRLTARMLAGAGMAFVLASVVSAAQAATATQLVLPQASAFAILGHSCGGIQETVYATGFDTASGFPTGVVQMSTRCGGSGRGGGYHTTTYSASAGVSWDFTGTVVSYDVPAPSVTVDPAFAAYDTNGNEVYNQSNSAFLVLAPGYFPLARVGSVAPSTGTSGGGTTVTIAGDGFTGATGVKFGSVEAASFTVTGATSVTAVSPVSVAGTVDVTVINPGGSSATSAGDHFTFVAMPAITGVAPNSGSPAGGTEVTITGASLSGATRVAFGGTSAGFVVNSDSSITAYAPALEEAGTVDVKVTTAGGTSARVSADRFSYVVSRPVVTGLSPSFGSADGGDEVTIFGANLSGATSVSFGGVAASFWVNDDTSLTAYSPAASAGTVDVTVTSYGLRSTTSPADKFAYLVDVPPTVAGLSPSDGPEAGGAPVVITGTSLTNTVEVDFGGIPVPFDVIDGNDLLALSPAGTGTVHVTVITDGGTSATSAADLFTFVPAPAVTGVSPSTGSGFGGTSVTVGGTGLAGATEVDFGGSAAAFTVNPDGSLAAVARAGAAGTVDVTVTTDGGMSAVGPADQFTYA